MDLRTRLNVLYDDGGVFTDYSRESQDFKRDSFTISLTTDDFIYIGFYKPINALYFDVSSPNNIDSTVKFEFFTNGAWTEFEVDDDTKAFSRSGFITWNNLIDGSKTTVNGTEAYWVRLSEADNLAPVTFEAISLVFSDDNDISQEVPALIDPCFYQSGQTSHILHHVAARNYIIGRLRTLGYVKYNADTGEENITMWDILDIYELRQASTYYAIAQIYFNLSDNIDDQYWLKYKEYEAKFEEMFGLGRLRIDIDDDGELDANEKRPIRTLRWGR